MSYNVLAFDFGASSGRAMLGSLEGGKVSVQEIHRFSNDPEIINGMYYWDIIRLFHEIKTGLLKAKAYGGYESVAIDTWGVDFGLLDSEGRLLGNVYHYRNARNEAAAKEFLQNVMPMQELYRRRLPLYEAVCDMEVENHRVEDAVEEIVRRLGL